MRRTTAKQEIRDCVLNFSKGAPQEACQSSNKLLKCSIPFIKEKCSGEAVLFVEEYVYRFAIAIDPTCKLGQETLIGIF